MKLIEISTESSAERFKSLVRDLVSNIYKTNGVIEDMISRGTETGAKRTAGALNARWFSQNYPALQSAAMSLRGVNKNFDVISKIPVNAYLGGGTTKGDGYRLTVAALNGALNAIGGRELFDKYKFAVEKQFNLLASTKADDEAPTPRSPTPIDPRKAAVGSQTSQVEAIVNATIKDLPSALQHSARLAVSQSDNKLVALQKFMASNNI